MCFKCIFGIYWYILSINNLFNLFNLQKKDSIHQTLINYLTQSVNLRPSTSRSAGSFPPCTICSVSIITSSFWPHRYLNIHQILLPVILCCSKTVQYLTGTFDSTRIAPGIQPDSLITRPSTVVIVSVDIVGLVLR